MLHIVQLNFDRSLPAVLVGHVTKPSVGAAQQ